MSWITTASPRRRLLVNLVVLLVMLGTLALAPAASGDMIVEDDFASVCTPNIYQPHTDGWGGINCGYKYGGQYCCQCPSCCRWTCV